MSKILIVTDSTAYLSPSFLERYNNVHVVPLTVNFEDVSFEDSVENNKLFVEKLKNVDKMPSTSRPAPEKFLEVFKPAVEEGGSVVCITLSSKLSGTYESALAAAKELGKDRVRVVDSKTTISGQAWLVEMAAKMAQRGETIENIVEAVEREKEKIRIALVPGTLEYLKKGGRIGGARALLGTILNIKPVLNVSDGYIEVLDKVRTAKKAFKRMVEEIPEDAGRVVVSHLMAEEEAARVKQLAAERAPQAEIDTVSIGPVISAHVGPGTTGVIFKARSDL